MPPRRGGGGEGSPRIRTSSFLDGSVLKLEAVSTSTQLSRWKILGGSSLCRPILSLTAHVPADNGCLHEPYNCMSFHGACRYVTAETTSPRVSTGWHPHKIRGVSKGSCYIFACNSCEAQAIIIIIFIPFSREKTMVHGKQPFFSIADSFDPPTRSSILFSTPFGEYMLCYRIQFPTIRHVPSSEFATVSGQ